MVTFIFACMGSEGFAISIFILITALVTYFFHKLIIKN